LIVTATQSNETYIMLYYYLFVILFEFIADLIKIVANLSS